MRTMYDGTAALAAGIHQQFPQAEIVAGYVDGSNAWSADEWALWPGSTVRVEISVVAAHGIGDVLDVENGDATPAQGAGWIAARRHAGYYRPTIYCNRITIPDVRQGTGSYVLGVDYDIWVADWTGQPHQLAAPGLPAAMCAATQYESTADYDVSGVYDGEWPHRQPPPTGIAAPAGLSGTPWEFAHLKWDAVPGVRAYAVQIELASGQLLQETVTVPAGAGNGPVRWQSGGFEPQAARWRVAAMGGSWSAWTVLA